MGTEGDAPNGEYTSGEVQYPTTRLVEYERSHLPEVIERYGINIPYSEGDSPAQAITRFQQETFQRYVEGIEVPRYRIPVEDVRAAFQGAGLAFPSVLVAPFGRVIDYLDTTGMHNDALLRERLIAQGNDAGIFIPNLNIAFINYVPGANVRDLTKELAHDAGGHGNEYVKFNYQEHPEDNELRFFGSGLGFSPALGPTTSKMAEMLSEWRSQLLVEPVIGETSAASRTIPLPLTEDVRNVSVPSRYVGAHRMVSPYALFATGADMLIDRDSDHPDVDLARDLFYGDMSPQGELRLKQRLSGIDSQLTGLLQGRLEERSRGQGGQVLHGREFAAYLNRNFQRWTTGAVEHAASVSRALVPQIIAQGR